MDVVCPKQVFVFILHFQFCVIHFLILFPFPTMQEYLGSKWVSLSELYYGGILKDSVPVSANDSDITLAAKFAVDYAVERSPFLFPRDDKGQVIPWDILDAKKMKLPYTKDGKQLHIHEEVLEGSNGPQLQKRQAILGIIYFFTVAWPSRPGSLYHIFSVNKDREKRMFVYSHYCHRPVVAMQSGSSEHHPPLPGNSRGVEGVRDLEATIERKLPSCSSDPLECHSQVTGTTAQYFDQSEHKHSDQSESSPASSVACTECNERESSNIWVKGSGGAEKTAVVGSSDSQSALFGRFTTYNIWNFNSQQEPTDKYYAQRMAQMGKLLSDSASDFIGIQEGRYDQQFRGKPGPSQVTQLAEHLPNYQFVYQPAQCYQHGEQLQRVEEGLILFSKHNILSHDFILLPRNTTEYHQRICLHAEVEHPALGIVHVFVAHLSLMAEPRERSVVEIWRFMQQHLGVAVLLGDFNSEPHETSMRFLRGEVELQGHKTEGLLDAWTAFYDEPRPDAPKTYRDDEPRDLGLTFSTLEENLGKRIDYVFVRLTQETKLIDVALMDDGLRGDHAASDHLGVSVVLAPASQT